MKKDTSRENGFRKISFYIRKNYNQQVYACDKKSIIRMLILSISIVGIVAYFFYHSVWSLLVVWPVGVWFFLQEWKKEMRRRKREFGQQFKDALVSVVACMRAGYAVENAFRQAKEDMEVLYGKHSDIARELRTIKQGLQNNITLEQLIYQLGVRSGIDDIQEFGEVFRVAKRSGGNLTEIMDNTVRVLEEKMDVEREISVLISAREMEGKVMQIIPFFIILYISISSPGFMSPMYGDPIGWGIMTVALIVYMLAIFISDKIVQIEV